MNVVVTIGQNDDGKDVSQWLRVACFRDAAEKIAVKAKKGDRLYVEGQLTLNTWADKATGETKTGLNVASWKCEKVAAIGKSRARQDHGNCLTYTPREKPYVQGRDGLDHFNDELGF
jgi:single-stranded DNA-binding protein